MCIPASLPAQFLWSNAASAEAERRYNELYGDGGWGRERQERLNQGLKRINDQYEDQIRRIREWNPILPGINNDQQKLTSTPRGGIQITNDPPRTTPHRKGNSRRQQEELRQRQRDNEHRAWLEERREQQREAARRQRERERLRAEEDFHHRQQIKAEVSATEYIREGARTQRLSDAAEWRTHEGADILDRTHTASGLMRRGMGNNFGDGTISGNRHRMRPLKRKDDGFRLDPHAIPWATMAADAQPWENWRENLKVTYLPYSVPAPETNLKESTPEPRVLLTSPQQWSDIEQRIPSERFDMIKAVIYDVNGGVFPQLSYNPDTKQYEMLMLDKKRILKLDEDGGKLTIETRTEKDNSVKNALESVSLSANAETTGMTILGADTNMKIGSSYTPFKGKVSENAGIGNLKVKPGEKDYLEYKQTIRENNLEKEKGKDSYILTDKSKKQEIGTKASLSANTTLVEKPSLKTETFYFGGVSEKVALGWERGVAGPKVKANAKFESRVSTKGIKHTASVNAEATLIEGNIGGTTVFKVPWYDGVCFSHVNGSGGIGYKYSRKRNLSKSGKDEQIQQSFSLGSVPLAFTAKGAIVRCTPMRDINEALKKAQSNPSSQ